ncbi:MAG TPA: membrane protein insertase YidC [Hydrogenothermaceae bacterium]|nr:membrane protein insertase YidC [Hydrogenothermaceae bacterium]
MLDNNQQEMQKRLMIFFLIVSAFMIGFGIFQTFIPTSEQNKTQQTQTQSTTQKVQEEKHKEKENISQKSNLNLIKTTGNYDLILTNQRFNSDNLKNVIEIKTSYGKVQISKIGARVVSVYLNQYKIDAIPKIAKDNKIFPTEIITTDPRITALLNFSEYKFKQEGNLYFFELNKDNIYIKKVFKLNDDETISVSLEHKGLENLGIATINGITPPEEETSFGHRGSVIKTDKELIKIDADIQTTQIIRDNILWAGEENKYFLQMLANKTGFSTVYVIPITQNTTITLAEIKGNLNGFFFGGAKLYSLLGEITEKYRKLWDIDLNLRETIDFGFFGILGKPLFLLLHLIYDFIPNWGIAIIILTIILRIVLFPLNHKSLKAMKKMADLAPEIQKLQKKYKDDPQKLQQEMMRLYAEHGANPMSGCLPILAQIPIFIALYNVLMVAVELKNIPFLWVPDLSEHDPFYILPILMGLSMVAQQWITPSSDKNQKFIMYAMAGIFTFLFMNFPAGLVLYWLINNILGLIQSFFVNKTINAEKK